MTLIVCLIKFNILQYISISPKISSLHSKLPIASFIAKNLAHLKPQNDNIFIIKCLRRNNLFYISNIDKSIFISIYGYNYYLLFRITKKKNIHKTQSSDCVKIYKEVEYMKYISL